MSDSPPAISETFVIYKAQGHWVAHGLRTDQFGVGERIVDALADYMIAVQQVLALAAEDERVAYLCDAPMEIQEMANGASPLPGEIYEVAYKMAHGTWPEDWEPPTPKKKVNRFRAEYRDPPIPA